MDEHYWAFVDEYGTTNLDTSKRDVGNYFIIVVVIVPQTRLAEVRTAAALVREKHFPSGKMEVKSKRWLKKNSFDEWNKVVLDIASIDFGMYALAVDKNRVDRASGFRWKNSFYKNVCRRAYSKVLRAYPHVHVCADRYGDENFKEEFGTYLSRSGQLDLFERGTFEWSSEEEPLTQLADILCGLLARCYDAQKRMPRAAELLSRLRSQLFAIDEWPWRLAETWTASERSEDARIAQYSAQAAERFIREHENDPSLDRRCQVSALEHLLLLQRFGDGSSVRADALYEHLSKLGLDAKSTTWVRHNVIAPLRDAGVLVTSSTSGYRLPTSGVDFEVFARHAESVCLPMLRRVGDACRMAKLITSGDIDVLGNPDFRQLDALIRAQSGPPEA